MEEGRRIFVRHVSNYKYMIIFLYGPDSYRRQEKLKEYVERYEAKYSALSLGHFYLNQESDLEKLKDFSKSQSLFESSRVCVVWSVGNLEGKSQKDLINLLKENLKSKDLTLIINEEKKPTKEFSFLLKDPVISHKFENLSGSEFKDFLEKETRKRGLVLDKESQNLLMAAYSGDTWGLITELDKLALLNEKKINKKILENHLDIFLPVKIYDIINEMRNSKSAGARLSLLEELFSRSEDPVMIFNIMAVSPYADKKWKEAVADYDSAIKSGKLEQKEVLLDLIL